MEANRKCSRWTWAEFARLPSEGSTRNEVIAGELFVTPGPAPRHQRVVMRLIEVLNPFVRAHDLGELLPGPVDVIFAEGDYLEPDLVFLCRGRDDIVTDRGIEGPPDLVVEIVSPSTAARDRGIKRDRYQLYGVPEYWVVDPEQGTFEVWDFESGREDALVFEAGDRFEWTPVDQAPTLEVEVRSVTGEP
jgi:Uma2 family endonuclease